MGKSLILFRHAKSDWDAGTASDHERPLNDRGNHAAGLMGRVLADSGQIPDLVITSSAVRARTTVELAAKAGEWKCRVTVSEALYDTTPGGALDVINAVPADCQTLLLAGHQSTWSDLVSILIGGGRIRMPTAAMVRIDYEIDDWQAVQPGRGMLVWHLQPKFFGKER